MDDPDAPAGTWDHWVIYNIPPHATHIEEGKAPEGVIGLNTSGGAAYYGACPPNGQHRYFFKLYALDEMLTFADPKGITKNIVEDAMDGHILEKAELIGLYRRS
jgi:Raf kinase inhibitor-like YbhB/YbcL family protein